MGDTCHAAGGARAGNDTAGAVVGFDITEEIAAVAASVVVTAYCIAMAAIHLPMLFCCT